MANLWEEKVSNLYHFPEDDQGMIRDYCFVGDIVKANLTALEKGDSDFFNIGTGKGIKTQELYEIIYKGVKEMRPEIPGELLTIDFQPEAQGIRHIEVSESRGQDNI